MMTGGVLSIDRAYFDITGGRERWLYKVARKHAGGAGEAGFAIALPTLFEKSGAEGQYRRFKFEIARIVERDELPGYRLALETVEGQREPMLRMRRRPGGEGAAVPAAAAPSPVAVAVAVAAAPDAPVAVDVGALVRRSVTSLSTRAQAGDLTDATLATLRAECPGWDYQTLHAEFRTWVEGDPARTPVSYQNAFIGYVRRYHARNRHLLRG